VATVLRVNLRPALKHAPIPSGLAVLDREGPFACLGLSGSADGLAIPVVPSATSLFGPRGASLIGPRGPLWVSDTGHHRLLGWATVPDADNVPADWVIGQPDFTREGRNAKGQPGPATLNVPTGITPLGDGIAVADAWNHRVLIWHERPECRNAPADVVLGQADFASVEANGGQGVASAQSLFWPYGVHWDGARLWVADTGNRRVLMWHGVPMSNGCPADLVLGQHDFGTRDENGGGEPSLSSMRWPHDVTVWNGSLCVTDAGNNRIMIWDDLPTRNNQACNRLLGQIDPTQVDHNQSLYWPSASTLHMPYGIASSGKWLVAADTANSRLLGWHADDNAHQASARALTGQEDFHAKGDNRWALPSRGSLCWPYGIAVCGDVAVVADSGNNRVPLWRLAPDLGAS
jgi:NHL repeat